MSEPKRPATAALTPPDALPDDFVRTRPEGLTEEEAAQRARDGLDNRPRTRHGRSPLQIVCANLFTLFNLLNAALAAALAAVGAWRNMLFLGVILSNTLIGTVQELRSRRAIERLKLMSRSPARVLRGGREREISQDELVQGDLIVLHAGDQVPADAVVVGGGGAANESVLTGESRAVFKADGDWLLSGSFISVGTLTAQLVHVGDLSYVNRLTAAAKQIKPAKSGLLADMRRLVRIASILLVPTGLLLFAKSYFLQHEAVGTAVPRAVAAMIGMLPEGLILLTSVALMAGVVKLARRRTLVRQLYSIESLARVDTLCLDKTGTLTTGEMQVDRFIPLEADEAAFRRAVERLAGASDRSSHTMRAVAAAVTPGDEQATATLPFTSERKKSAVSFADGTTLVMGAPTFVLGEGCRAEWRETAEAYAARGMRVVVVAEARGTVTEDDAPPVTRALGFIVIEDTIRESAAETLRYFRGQGVDVKVISGDDPRTVSEIASRLDIPGADRWVDASSLREDADYDRAARECTVFGRVTPDGKRRLVEALKRCGRTVAMTGDGVNDIPAMKASDCSIAMGNGTDAARNAAQLTLLDSDFSALPGVVAEGRRVINNIGRAATLFLVKTLYSMALGFLTLVLPASYPFQPIQLTLISSLTIGMPSFFLAFEPNAARVEGHFLRRVIVSAIPGAAAVTLCALSAALMEHIWPADVCSTIATLSALAVGLVMLLSVCLPFTKLRAGVFALSCAAAAVAVLAFGHVFFLVPLTTVQALTYAGLALAGALIVLGVRFVVRRWELRRAAGR